MGNLRPFNTMSPEEHREISRKGGQASAAARKRRKEQREAAYTERTAEIMAIHDVAKLLYAAAGSPRKPRKKHKYIYRI